MPTTPTQKIKRPDLERLSIALVLLAVPLTAVLVDLGRIHEGHNGDTLVPVLMSLHRWLPYFWGQSRFGMLVPLLAMPFHDALTNLMVQVFLCVLAAIMAPFLLARFLFPRDMALPLGALTMGVCFLTQQPAVFQHTLMLPDQPYSVGMCLCVGGLLILETRSTGARRIGHLLLTLILMFLGTWVNMGILFSLGPLLFFRTLYRFWDDPVRGDPDRDDPDRPALPSDTRMSAGWNRLVRPWYGIGVLIVCGGANAGLSRLGPNPPSQFLDAREFWVQNIQSLGLHFHEYFLPAPAVFTLGALGGVGLLGWICQPSNPRIRRTLAMAAIVALTFVSSWLVIGTLRHVHENDCAPRYLTDGFVMLELACVAMGLSVVYGVGERDRKGLHAASAVFLVVAGLYAFGPPRLHRVHKMLEDQFGADTDAVQRLKATHIAGDYWTVWPTMFLYETRRHDAGSPAVVWGVANRCAAIADLLIPGPASAPARIAVKAGQARDAEQFLRMSNMWPCEKAETVGEYEVWRIRQNVAGYGLNWGRPADARPWHWCDQWATLEIWPAAAGKADLVMNIKSETWPVRLTLTVAGQSRDVTIDQADFHVVKFAGLSLSAGPNALRIEGTDLKNATARPWITVESAHFEVNGIVIPVE